ncbi:hypothetical protein G3M81_17580 [Bacillus paralicheniformis]|uniref:hypothetical protein n=1 Tax=Bacillus paralicheniformis TaxID=1648923 RepID=UPI0013EF019E|nr:hypothetical protein [Bacillus paralicheniformis]QII50425.1 hypothetical protein G3M81_17580 [Bacillus paralicheniformis]
MTNTLGFPHAAVTGQGVIALAALRFGKGNPIESALFFGFTQSYKQHRVHASLLYRNTKRLHADCALRLIIPALAGFIGLY